MTKEKRSNLWNIVSSLQHKTAFQELKGLWKSKSHPSPKSEDMAMLTVDLIPKSEYSVEKTLKGLNSGSLGSLLTLHKLAKYSFSPK